MLDRNQVQNQFLNKKPQVVNKEKISKMICLTCAGEMKSGKTNVPFDLEGDRLIVVKDVKARAVIFSRDTRSRTLLWKLRETSMF